MLSQRLSVRPHVCRQPVSVRAPVQHRLRKAPVASAQSGVGLSTDLKEYLDGLVHKDKIVAFIKGTKQFPQCGFSNTVVQVTYGGTRMQRRTRCNKAHRGARLR